LNIKYSEKDTVTLNQQIEVTGFYNGISISDAPSNVYILTENEINSRNGKNVGEILNSLPGIFINLKFTSRNFY